MALAVVLLLMIPGTAVVMGLFAIAWTLLFTVVHALGALFSRVSAMSETEAKIIPLPTEVAGPAVVLPAVSA